MARFNYDWSDKKLQQYINEGRGQKSGSEYIPWLNVRTIASRGRVSRVSGWKTGRVHHFLSDNELRYFYLCEFSPSVIDIREHYPLIDLYEMATEILDDELLKKLVDSKTGTPHILTSTFLITTRDAKGKESYFARNIKEAKDLEKPSIISRYESIRRYFEVKGIPWALITPMEINQVRAKNVEWIHTSFRLSEWGYSEEQAEEELMSLVDRMANSRESLRNVFEQFDQEYNRNPGTGLLLFKHLLATKKIRMDMDKLIDINQPASIVEINGFVKGSKAHVSGC
ncbi:TnsA endonuclease C-terminal domain-containing protein [Brevibacillus borstelensis]|uniref:TnsA endonuclease C-terminal domain-containing protein n=1 Tax=Brevibacillus borstelensis TaxID=45462 RepID=UPI002040BA95|nr:TnsA endonuclease C-terminal domain-containing protein [Brevibacillus borstelensis]MCM3623678.1 TnsA endonuclease C-terminal domain-containing protein [Brevibacillus borstelensis]